MVTVKARTHYVDFRHLALVALVSLVCPALIGPESAALGQFNMFNQRRPLAREITLICCSARESVHESVRKKSNGSDEASKQGDKNQEETQKAPVTFHLYFI